MTSAGGGGDVCVAGEPCRAKQVKVDDKLGGRAPGHRGQPGPDLQPDDIRLAGEAVTQPTVGDDLVERRPLATDLSSLARAAVAAARRRTPFDAALGMALDIADVGLEGVVVSGLPHVARPLRWVTAAGYERWMDVLDGRCGWWEDTLPLALVPERLAAAAADPVIAPRAVCLISTVDGIDAVCRVERWAVLAGGLRAAELLASAAPGASVCSSGG